MDDRTAWLDSWCKVRSLSQQELARRWSRDAETEPLPPEPKPLSPIEEMKSYVASTMLRPMRQDEAYTDYERKYWRMLRIPDEQSDPHLRCP